MIRKSCDEHPFISALVVLLVLVSLGSASELKPEELVAKHLDSIGTADARKAIKSRVAQGTAQYTILVGGAGTQEGKAVLVSEQNKIHFLFKFPNNIYRGEQIVTDGSKIEVAATTAQRTRSPLGTYLYTQDAAIRDGLLGGVLSTAWPLFDSDVRKAKLSYLGLKTIDGKQLHDLHYKPKKGSDQEIDLFFEPDTFRHVLTIYKLSISQHLVSPEFQTSSGAVIPSQSLGVSSDEAQSRQQATTRYRVEERFSDFKTADGLTLPSHYNLHFTNEQQSGATAVYEWSVSLSEVMENPQLDPKNFEPK
jgi:outer membrane lipoprotein-sorting protein